MKVTKVSVTFDSTIPTQPYGNVKVAGVWEATLDEGENPRTVTEHLFGQIRETITEALRPIAQAKMKQVQPFIDSLPHDIRTSLTEKFGIIQWLMTVSPTIDFAAPEPKTTASVTGVGLPPVNGNGADTPPWEVEKK